MPVTEDQREAVETFRAAFEAQLADDERFGAATRHDRDDASTLATQFAVAENLWVELAVRPLIPQVRVGLVTSDRWLSEDLENAIEDTGDTMSEFLETGFDEVGLEWIDPPVEHYREAGKYFYFATPLELSALAELGQADVAAKVRGMLLGYYEAFKLPITKANAEEE